MRALSLAWSLTFLALPVRGQDTGTGAEASNGTVPDGAPEGMALVDRADLRRHATFLASDELRGRYTGSEGQQRAAEYIAERFEELGLLPLGDRRRGRASYFQTYELVRTALDPKASEIRVGAKAFEEGFAVIPGSDLRRVNVSGNLEFCGRGAPEEIPRSLRRRIPVVALRAVGGGDRAAMAGSVGLNKVRSIQRELESRGAACAIYLIDGDGGFADALAYQALLPGKPLVTVPGRGRRRSGGPLGDGPAIFAAGALGDALIEALGVDADGQATSKRASGRVRLTVEEDDDFEAVNVVGVVRGESRDDEAVVFSAHMDHIGVRLDGDVFNGADDNASGSSGLLEIAEAFAKGPRPARSIVFLSVSGEELGLWGSAHFADDPTWPLERTIADINIDMIGRLTDSAGRDEIEVTPTFRHAKYSTLVQEASRLAGLMGMRLTNGDQYYERSDHYNFARKGIPVVFFCNGEHPDYHKVTDEVEKLDFEKMERVARLAYWLGYSVADTPARPRDLGSRSGW